MSLLSKSQTESIPGHAYPAHYWQSRHWFRSLVGSLQLEHQAYEIETAADAEPVSAPASAADDPRLTIDVAAHRISDSAPTLIVSSGLHGAEGFLGGAVQQACLQDWLREGLPEDCNLLLIHALNPHGFALRRRFDSENIDPNRNFLLPNQTYSGAPPIYQKLDRLLNPRQPDRVSMAFWPRALGAIVRFGYRPISAAVAQGQYEFPQGLFFGGKGPGETQRVVDAHFDDWLSGSGPVLHLDFHTGLGPFGQLNFLMEQTLTPDQLAWLNRCFDPKRIQRVEQGRHLYEALGSFGEWCIKRNPNRDYIFMCAEVGTYSAGKMLRGLRDENCCTHWCRRTAAADSRQRDRQRDRLEELFCPASEAWRVSVLEQCQAAVQNGLQGLRNGPCKSSRDSHPMS